MKYTVLIISLVLIGCSQKPVHMQLGQKYDIESSQSTLISLPSGSFVRAIDEDQDGIKYTVAVKEDRVVFLSTRSHIFECDGTKVGDRFYFDGEQVITRLPGWGCFYKCSEDGWYAATLCMQKSEHSKIEWFFKYNF